MAFICETLGCEREAKVLGKCMFCATRAAKERHGIKEEKDPPAKEKSCDNMHYANAKKAKNTEVKDNPPAAEKPGHKVCACGVVEDRSGDRRRFFRKGKCRKCYESERWQKRKKSKHLKEGGPGPICGLPIYHITVDFSKYPKLHERLFDLAEAEMRTTGAQLLYLLKDELDTLEAKA